jgi:hypothetical protein
MLFAAWGLQAGDRPNAKLTPQAEQALAKAERDVKSAAEQRSLWTTADEAIKRAREAAQEGRSDDLLKYAAIASVQARLGIDQTRYPPAK